MRCSRPSPPPMHPAWRPATCSAIPAISPTRSIPASRFRAPATASTPFLESDVVLGDVDEHFAGNYLDEATILKLARDKGYSTASIGKIGPALIFDPTERTGEQTILVDDATGTPKGIPLSADVTATAAGGGPAAGGADARRQRRARQRDDARHARPPMSCSRITSPRWRPKPCCRCSRTATSRSCWCSGRAIPTAPSTIRATA